MTRSDAARLQGAAGVLQRGCEPEALAVVRSLAETYGDLPRLVEAQGEAFAACHDARAQAELMARTMPEVPSAQELLGLGAAWVRAAQYEEAAAVLEPLAQREGKGSQAAWLAGFALFHAGELERARLLLESARGNAARGVSDAWLLIGLCKLHAGDVEGAIDELEAGLERVPDDVALWTALARAYAAAARGEDAARAEERARASRDARAERLQAQMWLAALATAMREAAAADDVEEVERIFERMWPNAPPKLRKQMLEIRADVYAKAQRHAESR